MAAGRREVMMTSLRQSVSQKTTLLHGQERRRPRSKADFEQPRRQDRRSELDHLFALHFGQHTQSTIIPLQFQTHLEMLPNGYRSLI